MRPEWSSQAIVRGERYAEALAEADGCLISAATLTVNRHGPKAEGKLHALVRAAGIEVESVTTLDARIAIEAFAN